MPSSNAVSAKARAVFGKSLTYEDYVQLAAKTSLAEVCEYLRQTERYEKAMAKANPQTIHRGQLEALAQNAVFDIFERFHRFDFSESRMQFEFIISQLEAKQIITAIEGVAAGSTIKFISELPLFLTKHSSVDLLALGTSESFADIMDKLEGTRYEKPLRKLLASAQESGNLNINECERRLYTAHYLSCLKTLEKNARGSQKSELKKCILRSIDMINVVSYCRMKAFSGADSRQLKEKLLPFRYRLNSEAIDKLAQVEDIHQLEQQLAAIGYRTDDSAVFGTAEQLTEKISLDYLRRIMRLSQNSSTVYYALTECLYTELNNIKTIIEGTRYDMSSSEILEMLVY
ncbi:MAG: V-type ATPase subunit [Oscillospiraceae bacterium]